MRKIIYLYILECSDDSYYTGVTNNIERRLKEHETGINTTCYTFNKRPVKLVWFTYFTDFYAAFEMGTRIKKWSRAKKKALIEENGPKLIELSKKKFL